MSHVDPPSEFSASDDERRQREAGLDETLAESFPASDPPSTDPAPTARVAAGDEQPSRRGPRTLTIALASAAGVVAAMFIGRRRRAGRRTDDDATRTRRDRGRRR
jgi:hypothetical protein